MRGYADGGHGQSTASLWRGIASRYPLADPTQGTGGSMSAEPRSDRPKAQPAKRTFAGNLLAALAFLFVFATMVGGAFGCVFLMLRLGDTAPFSSLIHEDGQGALIIGGIAIGG